MGTGGIADFRLPIADWRQGIEKQQVMRQPETRAGNFNVKQRVFEVKIEGGLPVEALAKGAKGSIFWR